MVRIILSIVSLIFLSWIIALNVGTSTDFNLFGKVFEDVSVVVIAFLSFVLGIIYSFGYYVYGRIRKAGNSKFRKKKDELKTKEKKLKVKEGKNPPSQDPPATGGPAQ